MLYLLPTPIGNLSDISLRALELLKACDTIICEDSRVCKHLIQALNSKFNADIKVKDFRILHSHNEDKFFSGIEVNFFDKTVLYLSDAGMPCVSDPGAALVSFAIKNNIAYEVLPGANAALTAYCASGFLDKEFSFFAFLSNKGKEREYEIQKLMKHPFISIVYEAPTRVLSLLQSIVSIDEDREIFVAKELSKKFEKKFKGKAKQVLHLLENENIKGEFVLVISPCKQEKQGSISKEDILSLDIALKDKSKLLAKLLAKNPKEIYNKLLLSQN